MDIPFVQIDAFATQPFEGNQACVMPLQAWLPDDVLQKIAAENNVAETAFLVPDGEARWGLRWFTPAVEVPLCGHATLAAAHYLYHHGGAPHQKLTFQTRHSGALWVEPGTEGRLVMDFPAAPIQPIKIEDDIVQALGARPMRAYGGSFYAAVFDTVDEVLGLTPDYKALAQLGVQEAGWERGNFGCLAPGGDGVDVTSRFFAPGSGIDEDPATGSWHCMLAPIMDDLTGKKSLTCFQAYPTRGAYIETERRDDRVKLKGRSVTVIEGVFKL